MLKVGYINEYGDLKIPNLFTVNNIMHRKADKPRTEQQRAKSFFTMFCLRSVVGFA